MSDNQQTHTHKSPDSKEAGRESHYSPCILWFTGLSAAGKTVAARAVLQRLAARTCPVHWLDGDVVRRTQSKDLGFSDEDRHTNIVRVGALARDRMLLHDEIVLVSLISPFKSARQIVRDSVAPKKFIEIFVDAPLSVCEKRDPKGLYKKARAGQIKQFTGIDSIFEEPESPEIRLMSAQKSVEALADEVISYLVSQQLLDRR